MRILALSGSLRKGSTNTTLLEAAAVLASDSMEIRLFDGLAQLPHFNPDLENETIPAVDAWRSALQASTGLIISTPEYAHGIPGALKNALDWVVGSGETVDLPIALFNATTRSRYAIESLEEVLRTMAGRIIPEACIALPLLGKGPTVNEIITDPNCTTVIRSALAAFERAISKQAGNQN
jgi:chromate reductase, NAD(P)H dehydrogenase (quinone)